MHSGIDDAHEIKPPTGKTVSIGVEDCPPSGGYRATIGWHIRDLCPCDCGWAISKLK